MPQAIIFAVTETADAFAMRTASGVVLLATADRGWTPKIGMVLTGYSHSLGRCIARDVKTGQVIPIEIKNCSDLAQPTSWSDLL